ncbi:CDP-glucose 4,6-dehydratase [Acidithiobacillus sp. HP-11]|nr:CDP-glucose 4,6-dehydratase [Acidithiobacillus sp. HP-11]
MNNPFWNRKKVFVTGHTGFKGSWLCLWLQELGAEVTGFSLPPPTNPSLFEVARISEGMHSIAGDIRELEILTAAMHAASPDIVIHMAAQPLVRYSYAAPVETYATNVMGTVHVLEAVRTTPSVRAVVNVTSDKCYENREWVWGYRENEAMGGYDPYSSSKGCSELVTSAYRNSYFNSEHFSQHRVALASVRAGNVIGGGDWAVDRLIPDILRSISSGQSVTIRNPHAIRPWQHVLEPLSGYLLLAQRLFERGPEFSEAWNFGPNEKDAQPVQWIVKHISELWGDGTSWQVEQTSQLHEAHYLKLDCSKVRFRLQWQPRWNLSQALQQIVAWQRAYLANEDMRRYTLNQIHQFSFQDNQ